MYFPLFVGVLCLSLFCYALLCVHSSFAIILKRKKKLVALLVLSNSCIVTIKVLWLFLTVPWVGLQCVSVNFPYYTLTYFKCKVPRTSGTLIGYLPIFQMLHQTSLCIRYHWYTFNRRLMYWGRIIVIIRQAGTYDKTRDPTKGLGDATFDFTKAFRNQLYPSVRILYYQYSITNHSESILKSKIMPLLFSSINYPVYLCQFDSLLLNFVYM